MGFNPIEYNASDTRNKKSIKELVAPIKDNKSITQFFQPKSGEKKLDGQTVLIMDEIDGMSSGDRGGMAEVIDIIKTGKIPLICICNDRQSTKIRSLANHCLDLRFHRPTYLEIAQRLREICILEGFHDSPSMNHYLQKLSKEANNDLRQALHTLQFTRLAEETDPSHISSGTFLAKEEDLNVFSAVQRLLSGYDGDIDKALNCFFADYQLIPLFIQENYPKAANPPPGNIHALKSLSSLSDAADSISEGDLISRQIFSQQDYGLLPVYGAVSCVAPAQALRAYPLSGSIDFPKYLGNNSSTTKKWRLLKELHTHMSSHVSATKVELGLDYLPVLSGILSTPMVKSGNEGIQEVMDVMESYSLTRSDWENVFDLLKLNTHKEKIPSSVRASFTKKVNALVQANTVSKKSLVRDTPQVLEDGEEIDNQEEGKANEDSQEEEEEDLSKDQLIKAKKSKQKKQGSKTAKTKPKKKRKSK